MNDQNELELWLDRHRRESYAIQLRFRPAGSETEHATAPGTAAIDLRDLAAERLDHEAYGLKLAKGLLADEAIRRELDKALVLSQSSQVPLRIRAFISPSAPELHELRWETLQWDDGPLLMRPDIFFSRYLTSYDWRPIKIRPQGDLRALVAIASPSDIKRYNNLAPIDVAAIRSRIERALGDIRATFLDGPGQATLEGIYQKLLEGYDLFYLVAHGALVQGEPKLWLVKSSGEADVVKGKDLAVRTRDLPEPPVLAVLASCQSAGTDDGDMNPEGWSPLSALGPRLSAAGIPAVLAIQGNLSMATEELFMPRFFEVVRETGSVDQAASLARAAARDRPDWWMPALFTRLRQGRIWYRRGFGDSSDAQDKWPAIIRHIRRSQQMGKPERRRRRQQEGGCTPVIGPGVIEPYVGRLQDVASYWADREGYPLEHYETEQLARISQFVEVKLEQGWFHKQLEEHLCRQLLRRHHPGRSPECSKHGEGEELCLTDLLVEAAKARANSDHGEAHRALAKMDLPLYLTANPDGLLAKMLEDQGKQPIEDICRWRAELIHDDKPAFEPLGDRRPDPKHPLVYYLFGHLDDPRSLVLSEDDHFDFLTGFVRFRESIPSVVRAALASTALLFVGFRLEDWSFRVLFRALINQESSALLSRLAHIAAQVEPEEGRLIDPVGARRFLSKYMGIANISLYWGSPEDFLAELGHELDRDRQQEDE